jgi:hypothetical protein
MCQISSCTRWTKHRNRCSNQTGIIQPLSKSKPQPREPQTVQPGKFLVFQKMYWPTRCHPLHRDVGSHPSNWIQLVTCSHEAFTTCPKCCSHWRNKDLLLATCFQTSMDQKGFDTNGNPKHTGWVCSKALETHLQSKLCPPLFPSGASRQLPSHCALGFESASWHPATWIRLHPCLKVEVQRHYVSMCWRQRSLVARTSVYWVKTWWKEFTIQQTPRVRVKSWQQQYLSLPWPTRQPQTRALGPGCCIK